ncbi:oxidoreductase [Intrasporangium oryzae NRRL B-24470]|uniref:Mannitol-1-phosphate 5-dehydrogenase n=1 Tax=Intrasporangium oryzae NRRL B-24470 TaxID=1386089 RepID=W9G348_9MICO|nr:mannitol dehydrogenase family protein [Intrasporangium oryzae]EWT00430.1 oxidoreductase [Intrasporangium oryzae NRRL B-24470]
MTTTDAPTARTPISLSQSTYAALPPEVGRPAYDRAKVTVGIVHFGVGGFHRAHQAMYVDHLLNNGLALDWGICGVGALPQDRRIVDTLTEQDGLYTLVVKHPDGHREARVIGSIVEMMFAPDDPRAVVDRLADPRTRIVSLTITEGGYVVNQVTGEFDAADEAIRADLVEGATPRTVFGYVVAALAARRESGVPPFTVMSCDNLPGNGDVARRMMTAFARLKDPSLADWMDEHVAFPNCMVDRITPVTAEEDIDRLAEEFGVEDGWPVVCEPFTQWVLEDHFTDGRPPLEEAGVQLVPDVVPYELMKLRLLNASHQALCYLGYLSGYRYAHDVCQDPLFVDFLLGYMEHEGSPTLPEVPGVDLGAYRHELIERFANPEVRDTLARLCAESSDRIPKWLVPVINRNLAGGGEIDRSALVVASWARYAEGTDEQGDPIEVVDRIRDRVMAAAARQESDPLSFLRDRDLFGDLVDDDRFTASYLAALESLHTRGARATLEAWEAKTARG